MNLYLKKILKQLIHYSAPALINGRKIIKKNHPGCVVPIILHHVPSNDQEKLKGLLQHLKKHYNFINPGQLSSPEELECLPDKISVLLTFDDGFFSSYNVAKNILEELDIKALFFITVGFIESGVSGKWQEFLSKNISRNDALASYPSEMKPMGWEDLMWLQQHGHTIGGHTFSHTKLSQLNDQHDLYHEIAEAGNVLSNKLESEVEHFAFPFGDINSISQESVSIAEKRYRFIHTGIRGNNASNAKLLYRQEINLSDSYKYNRLLIEGGLDFYYAKQRNVLSQLQPNSLMAEKNRGQ